MAAPPPPPHLNVKRGARDRLWNPNAGIRFAPKPDVEIVYPKLDTGRLGHAADSKRQAVEGDEYLSDVEEFERFAAEWYDQQDDLAAQKRPPKPIHEQVSAVVGINPEYAATPVVFGQKNEPPVAEKQVKKPVVLREPPVSACDFKISKELFEAALKSKPESAGSFWSHTMYSKPEPDGPAQKVKVHYCASKTTMEWVCNKYFQGEPVLGFDLEWCTAPSKRAGIRDNVSLIQLASPSRIALFHVAIFPKDDFNFPSFKQIMENEDVVKVGVAIRGDCTRLNQHTKITGKGLIELSHLYKLVKYSKERRFELINRSLVSLAQQTQEYLGIPLYKGKDVRISDWSRHLTNSQIHYGASDAYAGVQLYHVLEAEREKLDPCPPRPAFAEKGLPIQVAIPEEDVEEMQTELGSDLESDAEIEVLSSAETGTDQVLAQTPSEFSDELSDQSVEEVSDEAPSEFSDESAAPALEGDLGQRVDKAMMEKAMKMDIPSILPIATRDDPRIKALEQRLQTYVAESEGRPLREFVPIKAIGKYYLWHDGVSIPDIAHLLQRNTIEVGNDILQSIVGAKLPYSGERLRGEVLPYLVVEGRRFDIVGGFSRMRKRGQWDKAELREELKRIIWS